MLIKAGYVSDAIEAQMLKDLLNGAHVPHVIQPYVISGYGDSIHPSHPWGAVMTYPEHVDEVVELLASIHQEQ